MGQRTRCDEPGKWHHVTNRGVARRTLFESREDVRCFLARLARVCRRGLLEVHAYCLLLNHFHLLVRSPVGELSHGMRIIQNFYSRWFNRRRRRDGPLFRGRFLSRPVETEAYWWTLIRYIDFNPVCAGVVDDPAAFPHGSARHYARPGPRPRWLTRSRVEAEAMGQIAGPYDPASYSVVFGVPTSSQERELVERRLYTPSTEPDPLDDLYEASPAQVRAWLQSKAALADGTRPGVPVVTPSTVLDILREQVEDFENLRIRVRRVRRLAIELLAPGLLRDACGLPLREIAMRLDCSVSTAHAREQDHRQLVRSVDEYAGRAAELLSEALRRDCAPRRTHDQEC